TPPPAAPGEQQGAAERRTGGTPAGAGAGDAASTTGSVGSRGGALPPESGGSDAITSLRDLRELPELRRRFDRRTLALIATAVVIAVVVVVAVVATVASGEGSDGNEAKNGSSSSDGAKGGQDDKGDSGDSDKGGKDGKGDSGDKDAADRSGKQKNGGSALPDGYRKVTDKRFRFAMAMPKGWQRTGIAGANSGGKYGPAGGGSPKIQVDFNDSPLASAASAWRGLEPAVKGASSGYRPLGIAKTDWRDYPTVADWQFLRKENGEKVRVLNRGFKVDGDHGYAIMITCKASEWQSKQCTTLRETAFKTFKPVG
ncbi:serine/threonine protein kinase, partial [Streptomyces sp. SB3404]|nr:serine/threonine protein kinase [Streptomyces boncukensis]